ncbi:uncharacterized protein NEPG_02158 [Nematocida parisii ERTm1]|uniref:uncharacterized protein n=1 Tax=Nematocida parisii (strain ERTm1 / ATCC PRA-289) TaxID=881290 RepID=UPI000264B24A|nr:uncharacterized protein NEPG_02158 [Nematocida parisii ERTm1]EIJ93202.1 hypothetical protein NEPG_02158 [Nematocida parisii ERTm1]|eukprot:XP_013059985.1 hypothetical protein NEPG_02158 [Nematocida parisii ERTm1]
MMQDQVDSERSTENISRSRTRFTIKQIIRGSKRIFTVSVQGAKAVATHVKKAAVKSKEIVSETIPRGVRSATRRSVRTVKKGVVLVAKTVLPCVGKDHAEDTESEELENLGNVTDIESTVDKALPIPNTQSREVVLLDTIHSKKDKSEDRIVGFVPSTFFLPDPIILCIRDVHSLQVIYNACNVLVSVGGLNISRAFGISYRLYMLGLIPAHNNRTPQNKTIPTEMNLGLIETNSQTIILKSKEMTNSLGNTQNSPLQNTVKKNIFNGLSSKLDLSIKDSAESIENGHILCEPESISTKKTIQPEVPLTREEIDRRHRAIRQQKMKNKEKPLLSKSSQRHANKCLKKAQRLRKTNDQK